MPRAKYMTIERPPYKVYNRTFLKSVRWLLSYTAEENGFLDRFINEMKKLSYSIGGQETKAVMMTKPGIAVLANAQLIFINCSVGVYKGFKALKPELISILGILEAIGVQEVTNITCVKDNSFAIDKEKVETNPTEEFLASVLFKDSFVTNPFFTESKDGIRAIVTRSFSDTVKEAVMQMLVTVSWGTELPLSAALDKMSEMDQVSFDAWYRFVSDGVKQIMES